MPDIKLLVVDDEELMLRMVELVLDGRGFETSVARNAHEALRRIAAHRYEAYLVDVCLPGMSGIALANRIVDMDPDAAVVTMSGLSDLPQDAVPALRAGAIVQLPKPLDGDTFTRIVGQRVELRRMEPRIYGSGPVRLRADLPELIVYDEMHQLEGTVHSLGPRKHAFLLVLARAFGRWVSRQALRIDGLGEGPADTGASGAVKTMVNEIRQLLGPHRECLASKPGAYALRIDYGNVFDPWQEREPDALKRTQSGTVVNTRAQMPAEQQLPNASSSKARSR